MVTCLLAITLPSSVYTCSVLQIQSVRETNRLLDGRMQQLQSQLQESSANSKQARVRFHMYTTVYDLCAAAAAAAAAATGMSIRTDVAVTIVNVSGPMQESVMELTRERGDLDMKRMHAENELRQCQHAKQNLEMDKDVLQRDVTALQTQLDDKSEGLRQSWKDANAKASQAGQSYLSHVHTFFYPSLQLRSSTGLDACDTDYYQCKHALCESFNFIQATGWKFLAAYTSTIAKPVYAAQVHNMEQQLHDANNNNLAMTASNKQLEQQRQSLSEQLQTAQQACQEAQTQLRDQQAAFEEESASMHNLASRHKEERVSLEKDKQNLDASNQELLRTAEVRIVERI